MNQSETAFTIGEDLYGVSVAELQSRLRVLADEATRIERELSKKQAEAEAAHTLFGKNRK